MIKIRIHGEKLECEEVIETLKKDRNFVILQISKPYQDRGDSIYYRYYIDAEKR